MTRPKVKCTCCGYNQFDLPDWDDVLNLLETEPEAALYCDTDGEETCFRIAEGDYTGRFGKYGYRISYFIGGAYVFYKMNQRG